MLSIRTSSIQTISFFALTAAFIFAIFTSSCSAHPTVGTEDDALKTLRQITKDGKLPSEEIVLQIEKRFANSKTGALAKLLRARINFENKNFAGAEAILNSDVFRQKTSVADSALWLRGKSLQQLGQTQKAMDVFAELAHDFPNSLRTKEAKISWATMALESQGPKIGEIPAFLSDLSTANHADALLLTAKAFERSGDQPRAIEFYRKVYFNAAGSTASAEAEARLSIFGENLAPRNADELTIRAEKLHRAGKSSEALDSYNLLLAKFPQDVTPGINLKRLNVLIKLQRMADAQAVLSAIPGSSPEKLDGYFQLAVGYANAGVWESARATVNELRERFPESDWTPKTFVAVGMVARDKKNRSDESFFLKMAVTLYPKAVDVAGAQFELAWLEHEAGNLQTSSKLLTEHLARYVDKDTTNRGQAGYWAARDSERAGKINEACALYDAMLHRYGANWYGYLALDRLTNLRRTSRCQSTPNFAADSSIPKAVANLKIVTVAPETATAKELARADSADQLSTIGLFDWAIEELRDAKKKADSSPKINLALAKHYRLKSDNVNALLALKQSYPDYYAMEPEEMGREEWDIFYPLTNWDDIKFWGEKRSLDPYQIAGFIRQETIFNPTAKSGANAYGLMQLLIPTARSMAKKYGANVSVIDAATLFQPRLNIELGTAYIRDQYDKYGRIEFVAVAYNAGPGRVVQWQKSLPIEMDEFVEAIPFRETKGYVQGIIRNSAQYRRLYEIDGSFKANVGTKPIRAMIDSMQRDKFAAEYPGINLESSRAGE